MFTQFISLALTSTLFLGSPSFFSHANASTYYTNKVVIPPLNVDDTEDLSMEIKKLPNLKMRRMNFFKAPSLMDSLSGAFKLIEIVGPKLWQIVEKNVPVVGRNLARVSILPRGITSATELTSWKGPASQTYEITFKNGFGGKVVVLEYTVLFSHGGRFNDKGAYLANVTIDPGKIEVLWAYKFSLNGEINDVVNLGTKADPIMGLYVNLNYTVDTVLKHIERRNTFFLRADTGSITFVNQAKSVILD